MRPDELDRLTEEKQNPCISIILPTERSEKKSRLLAIKKAVEKTKAIVENNRFSPEAKRSLMAKLDDVTAHLPDSSLKGIGVFISPAMLNVFVLPFPVEEKIIVGDSFETRDLFYLKQYTTPYLVLALSKKEVRLFDARMDDLTEIRDDNFPIIYQEQYEYARAGTASGSQSLKGFERDKNQLRSIRIQSVFKEADKKLSNYLKGSVAGVVLAGTAKAISSFREITGHAQNIYGSVAGSFNENKLASLRKSAWQVVLNHQRHENETVVKRISELSNREVATGVQDVWKAAQQGKGLLLAVEKDFHVRAYQKPNQNTLFLDPPSKPYHIIPDAVDDLIETISKKNGKVLFTDNEQLSRSGHLALILRY